MKDRLRQELPFFLAIAFVVVLAGLVYYIKFHRPQDFKHPGTPMTAANASCIKLVARLDWHAPQWGVQLAISNDGRVLALENDHQVTVWTDDGQGTLKPTHTFAYVESSEGCCMLPRTEFTLSPNGQFLATSYTKQEQSTVRLWRVKDEALLFQFTTSSHEVRRLTFSPDSTHLLYTYGGDVYLWDVATGQRIAIGEEHDMKHVTFAPDSGLFYLTERTLEYINPNTTSSRSVIRGLIRPERLVVALRGNLLAIQDGHAITLYDARDYRSVWRLDDSTTVGNLWKLSDNGRYLLTVKGDNIRTFDIEQQRLLAEIPVTSYDRLSESTLSPSGDLLALYRYPYTVVFWDVRRGQKTATVYDYQLSFPLRFSPDGTFLATHSGHIIGGAVCG